MNTIILLTSGASCTWAHHAIVIGNRRDAIVGLLITLVLTIKYFQENEYNFEERDIINLFRKEYLILDIDSKTDDESFYVLKALELQKKLANKGTPYSFSIRLAPLTTETPVDFKTFNDCSLDRIVL